MLAKSVKGIPDPAKHTVGDITGLSFEPKWDGFRCLVFKDGDEVELASRNTKPLSRYFPEVVAAMQEQLPARCVLDGEVFVALRDENGVDRLEFETLQERIHPAKSRIDMLAEKTPAGFVAFDLLALDDTSYVDLPFTERRAAMEKSRTANTPPKRRDTLLRLSTAIGSLGDARAGGERPGGAAARNRDRIDDAMRQIDDGEHHQPAGDNHPIIGKRPRDLRQQRKQHCADDRARHRPAAAEHHIGKHRGEHVEAEFLRHDAVIVAGHQRPGHAGNDARQAEGESLIIPH